MVPGDAMMGIAASPNATLISVLAQALWMLGPVCLDSLPSSSLCWLIADYVKTKSVSSCIWL